MKFKVFLWNSTLIHETLKLFYSLCQNIFSLYMYAHTHICTSTDKHVYIKHSWSKNHFPSPSFTFTVQYTPIWCLSNEHPKLLPKVTFKHLAAKFSHESSTFVSSAADSADLRPSSTLSFLMCVTHFDGFYITLFWFLSTTSPFFPLTSHIVKFWDN